MSTSEKTRYRAIARFAAIASETLPDGATINAHRDRRGRLVLECAWPAGSIAVARNAVRIVLLAETLSCYITAPHKHRLGAQARFAQWVQERLEGAAEAIAGRTIEEWVMGPSQLFPDG